MAILDAHLLDAHLLDDLDTFRLEHDEGPESLDPFDDLMLAGCLWCSGGNAAECRHEIGRVRDGQVRLGEGLGTAGDRLASLAGRLARAVVVDGPRPIECRDLPGADRLMAAAEAAWVPLQAAARQDPDPDGWAEVLRDRITESFSTWCFALLCTLSGGTLHRLDEIDGSERWIAAEPDLLAAALDACLRGERDGWSIAGDPLQGPRWSVALREGVA